KCGRSSIMRALSSGELKAVRDNDGNWQITPDAVDDWLSMRRTPDRQSPDQTKEPAMVMVSDTPETLARLAALEVRAEMLAEQVKDLKKDRDAWRAAAEERRRRWWRF
ncbi:MAG: hypothetical protein KGI47_12045, partial [Betaproteobacteria bacterium]|nr:hypothetical protein [Betaproteobacteria bacterium]